MYNWCAHASTEFHMDDTDKEVECNGMMKRRTAKHETFKNWITQYDREYQTASWLDCETLIDRKVRVATKLKFCVYKGYKADKNWTQELQW